MLEDHRGLRKIMRPWNMFTEMLLLAGRMCYKHPVHSGLLLIGCRNECTLVIRTHILLSVGYLYFS